MAARPRTNEDHAEVVRRASLLVRLLIDRHEVPRATLLAASLSVAPRTLQRAFREQTGSTLRAAIEMARLEAAARRLRGRRKMPIAAVAQASGYKHSQHLAASFKRRYGTTPLRFRADHLRAERDRIRAGDTGGDLLTAMLEATARETRAKKRRRDDEPERLLAAYDQAKARGRGTA